MGNSDRTESGLCDGCEFIPLGYPDEEDSLTSLRHIVLGGVKRFGVVAESVPGRAEAANCVIQQRSKLGSENTRNVLHDERSWSNPLHETDELSYKLVTVVIRILLPHS